MSKLRYEQLLELVKARRSVRRLKEDPVPDGIVDRILEAARWAPSGADTQPWEFIVVKDEENRNKLLDAVEGTITVTQLRKVPVLIVVCGGYPRQSSLPWGTPHRLRGQY